MKHRPAVLAVLGFVVASLSVSGGITLHHRGSAAGAAGVFPSTTVFVAARSSAATDARSGFVGDAVPHDAARDRRRRGEQPPLSVATTHRRPSRRVPRGVRRSSPRAGKPRHRSCCKDPVDHDAIISGAIVLRSAGSRRRAAVYSRAWPHQWGPAPVPSGWDNAGITPIIRRRETLFVNDRLHRQVLSMSRTAIRGRAAVLRDDPSRTVFVKPPAKIDFSRAGRRGRLPHRDPARRRVAPPHAPQPAVPQASTAFGPAGQLVNVRHVLLDRVTFGWNNWTGLRFPGASPSRSATASSATTARWASPALATGSSRSITPRTRTTTGAAAGAE